MCHLCATGTPQVVVTAVVIVMVAGQLHLFEIRDVLGKRTEAVPIPCKRGRWLRYPPLVPGLMGRFHRFLSVTKENRHPARRVTKWS